MRTALLFLGVSVLTTAIGCDNGSTADDEPDGPKAVGGSGGVVLPGVSGTSSSPNAGSDPGGGTGSSTGGSPTGSGGSSSSSGGSAGSSAGGVGTGPLPEGVPLTSTDGWVDGASNTLGVQGAMFAFYDTTSGMGIVENFVGANACITGTAAKVDMKCTPVAPAVDCFGQYWGAAIGLNLNQPMDPNTGMGSEVPLPFDASALTGFAFEISGSKVPVSLRFKVEGTGGEFCTPVLKAVKLGVNEYKFSDLLAECWKPTAMSKTAETAKAAVVKVAWQVVTNASATVPFDFCVSNVRALQ